MCERMILKSLVYACELTQATSVVPAPFKSVNVEPIEIETGWTRATQRRESARWFPVPPWCVDCIALPRPSREVAMASPALLEAADLLRLHDCVLDGDVEAGNAIAAFLVETCSRNLRQVWPRSDPAIVQESVERAILSYLADPRSFDPTKGGLQRFIERAARRNVIDRFRAEGARCAREAAWAEEWARLAGAPEIPESPQTPHDAWPLLLGSQGPLTDQQWVLVEVLFRPRPRSKRGKPPAPIRPILDGLIELLRPGARWQDLTGHLSYRTCHRRFLDWCRSGVLKDALDRLEADLQRVPRSRRS